MMLKLHQRIGHNQKGFTMVELLMAMAVSGIIAAAAVTTISQVFHLNARTSNHMIAVRQVQSVGYWVSHDAQMAQIVTPAGNFDLATDDLVLSWTEWNGTQRQVTYRLADGDLTRNYSGNSVTIGQHIESATGTFASNKLTFTITATVGSGSRAESETRKYEVYPRPGS
jgi:prepilin-type N-terminal cleavage/methylation domain-containing protein